MVCMSQDHRTTTETGAICDAIGRKVVAARMGVTKTAVSNVVTDGVFPARWYEEMKLLCQESGVECPDRLFNFIRSADRGAA